MAKKRTSAKRTAKAKATRAAKKVKRPQSARQVGRVKKRAASRVGTKSIVAKSTSKKKRAGGGPIPLGRPRVAGDEKLYLLFKEDFHARQIFAFLRVETVRELEEYSPQKIIKRLTRPIHETVDRIRQKLAGKNRFLAGDEEYAFNYRVAERMRDGGPEV